MTVSRGFGVGIMLGRGLRGLRCGGPTASCGGLRCGADSAALGLKNAGGERTGGDRLAASSFDEREPSAQGSALPGAAEPKAGRGEMRVTGWMYTPLTLLNRPPAPRRSGLSGRRITSGGDAQNEPADGGRCMQRAVTTARAVNC